MSSLRRVLSSRANGARSRGPATAEGKRRSSYNAVRHGLLAKCVVMSGESAGNFEQLLRHLVDRFGPLDDVEFGMVEEMASSYWRLRRAWAIETRLLDQTANAQTSGDRLDRIAAGFSDLASQPRLPVLLRYQASLHRAYQRALHNLLLLRANCETNPVSNSNMDHDGPPPSPVPVPRRTVEQAFGPATTGVPAGGAEAKASAAVTRKSQRRPSRHLHQTRIRILHATQTSATQMWGRLSCLPPAVSRRSASEPAPARPARHKPEGRQKLAHGAGHGIATSPGEPPHGGEKKTVTADPPRRPLVAQAARLAESAVVPTFHRRSDSAPGAWPPGPWPPASDPRLAPDHDTHA